MGEGDGTPLQYFCLENPVDGGARQAAVHEVAKSQTQLSDLAHMHAYMGGEHNLAKPINIIGEGDGTPLQYSCLENPMDGGAWQAAVHEVAKSRT